MLSDLTDPFMVEEARLLDHLDTMGALLRSLLPKHSWPEPQVERRV